MARVKLRCSSKAPSNRFNKYGDSILQGSVMREGHITEFENDELTNSELVFKYCALVEGHEDKDTIRRMSKDIKKRGILLKK